VTWILSGGNDRVEEHSRRTQNQIGEETERANETESPWARGGLSERRIGWRFGVVEPKTERDWPMGAFLLAVKIKAAKNNQQRTEINPRARHRAGARKSLGALLFLSRETNRALSCRTRMTRAGARKLKLAERQNESESSGKIKHMKHQAGRAKRRLRTRKIQQDRGPVTSSEPDLADGYNRDWQAPTGKNFRSSTSQRENERHKARQFFR
jgi:hypothetical protein